MYGRLAPVAVANIPTKVTGPKRRMELTLLDSDVSSLDGAKRFAANMRDALAFVRADKTTYGWVVVLSEPGCRVLDREFHVAVFNSSLKHVCLDSSPCRTLDEVKPLIAMCETMRASK